jgi:hypothetical protein
VNGRLRFDSLNVGLKSNWAASSEFTKITVPVSLGVLRRRKANDIAWYARNINVSAAWQDKKTFFTIGLLTGTSISFGWTANYSENTKVTPFR